MATKQLVVVVVFSHLDSRTQCKREKAFFVFHFFLIVGFLLWKKKFLNNKNNKTFKFIYEKKRIGLVEGKGFITLEGNCL